jgi:hypothetical protein
LRRALDVPAALAVSQGDRRTLSETKTLLALALSGQKKQSDAQSVITPVLKFQRELLTRNHDDFRQHVEMAAALYAGALAGIDRQASLAEAAALLDGLPAEMRSLKSVARWRKRIREAGADKG